MPVPERCVIILKTAHETKRPAVVNLPVLLVIFPVIQIALLVLPAKFLNLKLNKMKKQIKKLSLNKKTISNLNAAEMEKYGGGPITKGKKYTCDRTCFNQRTCPYCW